mmetsp:Transcript_29608/g.45364  ORF Transcript_29608/g.45364 Transcript_29608/m.45364 type:complete len:172 (-) Transcript_29608:224-739(-)
MEPGKSLIDVGAGVGQLKRGFERLQFEVDYHGFDGGANVMELEGMNTPLINDDTHIVPHLCWVDASKPFFLQRKFDYVYSVEVGEHIPIEGEQNFMDNLVRLLKPNGEGTLFLSWAHPGQGGYHHVNEREREYVIAEFVKRGLAYDGPLVEIMKEEMNNGHSANWMVFHTK